MPFFNDLLDETEDSLLAAPATMPTLGALAPLVELSGGEVFQCLKLRAEDPRGAIAITPTAVAIMKAARLRERRGEETVALEGIDDVISAITHDLKEPLRTVSMFTHLLAMNVELDAEGKKLAQSVVAGVARIGALLEGLQTFAVGSFDGALQWVDLDAVVTDVLQNLAHAITMSGAVVTVGRLPRVRSNPHLLSLVLQNLVANAIKYRSKAPVEIHISASRLEPDWIIRVEDNGIGIAVRHHERIFGLLKRLHGQEIAGSGIGLATCRKIVESLGGAIWVNSEEGVGSTFCFTVATGREDEGSIAVSGVTPALQTVILPITLVKRIPKAPDAFLPGDMIA